MSSIFIILQAYHRSGNGQEKNSFKIKKKSEFYFEEN